MQNPLGICLWHEPLVMRPFGTSSISSLFGLCCPKIPTSRQDCWHLTGVASAASATELHADGCGIWKWFRVRDFALAEEFSGTDGAEEALAKGSGSGCMGLPQQHAQRHNAPGVLLYFLFLVHGRRAQQDLIRSGAYKAKAKHGLNHLMHSLGSL